MTLQELERWLAHATARDYHRNTHGALNVPPLAAWQGPRVQVPAG